MSESSVKTPATTLSEEQETCNSPNTHQQLHQSNTAGQHCRLCRDDVQRSDSHSLGAQHPAGSARRGSVGGRVSQAACSHHHLCRVVIPGSSAVATDPRRVLRMMRCAGCIPVARNAVGGGEDPPPACCQHRHMAAGGATCCSPRLQRLQPKCATAACP